MGEMYSVPSLIIFLINLGTLAFYYSFYRFHFYRFTENYLQYTALAFSLFSAGLALLLQALSLKLLPFFDLFTKSFILSSFLEEFSKIVGIFLFFRKVQDEFSVTDGIFYGLVLGGGFGLVENILYFIDTGLWSQVLRSITALPIHMMNGGLLGAFLMSFFFSKNRLVKWGRLLMGFFFCVFVHGYYNLSLFQESSLLIVLPISILTLFFVLELTIAKSRILLPGNVLTLMEMSLEEYEIMSRHNRHEGWIQNVQKHISTSQIKFFRIPTLKHFILTSFFLVPSIFSIYLFSESPEWITRKFPDLIIQDYIALFILYPMILAFMFFFGGIINPYFFRDRMLSVPLFSSVDLRTDLYEENSAIFYISLDTFYLPTTRFYPKGTIANFDFWIGIKCYENLTGKILWSRENEEGSYGAMCKLNRIPLLFLLQWNLTRFRQNLKNLLFRKAYV